MHVIPFPVNEPELWRAYVPDGRDAVHPAVLGRGAATKLERLRAAGYEVVMLDEGAEKEISGADVRAALRAGGDWESLVPPRECARRAVLSAQPLRSRRPARVSSVRVRFS